MSTPPIKSPPEKKKVHLKTNLEMTFEYLTNIVYRKAEKFLV